MKRALPVIACLLLHLHGSSQHKKNVFVQSVPAGNEWINYAQTYYKIKIVQDGVYRIDSLALAGAGVPVSSIDPRNFQVFGRGQELRIFIKGENDGVFNVNDYIEFFAEHNDGFLDSILYYGAKKQPNPYYSLFNDTAVYFLTWNNSVANSRLTAAGDTNFSAYSANNNYFFKEEIQAPPNDYFYGSTDFSGATDPEYDPAEGWFDYDFAWSNSKTFTLNTPKAYTSGPAALARSVVVGTSNRFDITDDHRFNITYKNNNITYPLTTGDTLFDGYAQCRFSWSIPASTLAASATDVIFDNKYDVQFDNGSYQAYAAVSFVDLKYPHLPDMENKSTFRLFVPDASFAKTYLDLSNFSAGGNVYLYDFGNNTRDTVYPNGPNYRVLLPNTGSEKSCFLFSDNAVMNISSAQIKPCGTNGTFTNFLSQPIDSAFVIISHNSLAAAAQSYKTYRSQKFNTVLADADELYDQFAYGVIKHPLAIRRFCNYLIQNASIAPTNLFLIGKAITAWRMRKSTANYAQCLVPTIGNPSCDNLFTAGLNGTFLDPAMSTGRLAASSPAQVNDYLNKVQQYESAAPAEWMKHVIHFVGGSSQAEQFQLALWMAADSAIIADTLFGGRVHTFKKTSSAPIQITLADSAKQLINNGVSIMHFFGHASGSGFDQNIDEPTDYSNFGKYPLIIANSCLVGDIHEPIGNQSYGTSEAWVMAQNRGVIGFLAAIGLQQSGMLNVYTNELYKNISYKNYARSIGTNIRKTVSSIASLIPATHQDTLFMRSVCWEMTLHGDPAVVINSFSKPDYEVDASGISFQPSIVTTEMDSFKVNVIVSNLGKAVNQPVDIEVKRIFQDNSDSAYSLTVPHIYYKDTITLTLPVDKLRGGGMNKFEVRVDPSNILAEMNEGNNFANAVLFIRSGEIIPIYPYEYAIVPATPTLKASTGDPFAKSATYVFELDTTDLFNSPFKKTQTVTAAGSVVKALPLAWNNSSFSVSALTDSTVYFWRVKKLVNNDWRGNWKESSFEYRPNKRGWAQAHFFQYKKDRFTFFDYNRPQRKFNFLSSGRTLYCQTYGIAPPNYSQTYFNGSFYQLDVTVQEYNGCQVTPALMVAVIDPVTLQPWGTHYNDGFTNWNPTHNFGNYNENGACRQRVEYHFQFQTNSATQMQGMKNLLENVVPNGYYILVHSWIKGNFKSWADTSLRTTFVNLGAAPNFASRPDTIPWIFFVKKGDLASVKDTLGTSQTQLLTYSTVLKNNNNFGTITTPLIGPALSWDSLAWRQEPTGIPAGDSIRVNVIGVDLNGQETTVLNCPAPTGIGVNKVFLNSISAQAYPYIKLFIYVKDDSLQTPAQVKKLQVFYQPAPEAVVNPSKGFSFYSDSVQEGDNLRLKLAVENVSEFSFTDSLQVKTWIVDKNKSTHNLAPFYIKNPLLAGTMDTIKTIVSTIGYPGQNSLWVEVNPMNVPQWRYEQYHFNNFAEMPFKVSGDKINPILDVTFDGIHIMNGDIVSAKPNVLIKLKDENKFLALNDPNKFKVYLKAPGQSTAQLIPFGQQLAFTPAQLPNNSCKLNYTPQLATDGIYELTVQAEDMSGNSSGMLDYKITFEIVNKSTITEVLNYPNPFSTSTRFAFILTGSEVPQQFHIQIMTVTGKVVREISQDELGPLHIGKNLTDYAWDGKDDFGDRLANGVYIYRVMARLNGNSIEHRDSNADQFFTKGYGKMYLMR